MVCITSVLCPEYNPLHACINGVNVYIQTNGLNVYIPEKGFNLYIHMNELGLNLYRNINEPHGCSASVSVCVYICVAALNTSHAVAAPCAAPGAAIWGPASQRLTEALVRVRHGVAAGAHNVLSRLRRSTWLGSCWNRDMASRVGFAPGLYLTRSLFSVFKGPIPDDNNKSTSLENTPKMPLRPVALSAPFV